jgi:hypothetical protein
MKRHVLLLLALAGAMPAEAQQSASFNLEEHTFNAGGRPDEGTVAQSASFRVSLDAIGEAVSLAGLTGASFGIDAGFVAPYPAPGEVLGLRFANHVKLIWDPDPSTGVYNLYRGLVASLSGLAYGSCHESGVDGESTSDADLPPANQAFFYLVTAENLLAEEGTKGFDSEGDEHPNSMPCP